MNAVNSSLCSVFHGVHCYMNVIAYMELFARLNGGAGGPNLAISLFILFIFYSPILVDVINKLNIN